MCNDIDVDIDFFSAYEWKYFSIRAEETQLILKDYSKNYELTCAYNPKYQELSNRNILKKRYREYGVTIRNLNLTLVEGDNVHIQSLKVPEGVMKLYDCKAYQNLYYILI